MRLLNYKFVFYRAVGLVDDILYMISVFIVNALGPRGYLSLGIVHLNNRYLIVGVIRGLLVELSVGIVIYNLFALADLVVDADRRSVSRGGREIALTSREYALLEYMMRNKGHVLTREQIIEHVWSYDYEGASNMVDVYIRNLRRKIDDGQGSRLIHTVRYMGYVLREES